MTKSNNQQTDIEEQLSPPSTVTKASGIMLVSGGDEVVQHFSPTNIPGPKYPKRDIISVLGNNGMGSDMHTRKEEK